MISREHRDCGGGCSIDAAGYPLCWTTDDITADVAAARRAADIRLGGTLTWHRFAEGDEMPDDVIRVQDRHYCNWDRFGDTWKPVMYGDGIALEWPELLKLHGPVNGQIRVMEEE